MPTRVRIIRIATAELGIRETTGRNDGERVEEYLRYTHLGKGYEWCAAFVCWCYGQAGLPEPRNPWSPALFPRIRTYKICRDSSVPTPNKNALKENSNRGRDLTITARPDLLAYGEQGRDATVLIADQMAGCKSSRSLNRDSGEETLEDAIVAERSRFEHRLNSLDLCGTFYQEKVPRPSANEDEKAVRWTKKYMPSKNRSFDYAQDDVQRLADDRKDIRQPQINPADIFGIYSPSVKRINHVGLVKDIQGKYLLTIEGNSNDRVESRRRHLSTIYALADWIGE